MTKLMKKMVAPLDERFNLTNSLHENLLDKPVPMHARRFWFCFGGLTFFVFLLQVASGIWLSFYYVPTPEGAYRSVFYISHYVNYGWLIRSIHSWGSQLMVIFVIAHMLRVVITGSYKKPRELNWVAGVLLFVITLAFGLTGYLLPWDQTAYWGSTVATSLMGQVPVLGPYILQIALGGEAIGAPTLTRFYSAHVFLLPSAIIVLLVAHFAMIRKQGISGPL